MEGAGPEVVVHPLIDAMNHVVVLRLREGGVVADLLNLDCGPVFRPDGARAHLIGMRGGAHPGEAEHGEGDNGKATDHRKPSSSLEHQKTQPWWPLFRVRADRS